MSQITCPNCNHTISLTVKDRGVRDSSAKWSDITPLTGGVLAGVFEFMKDELGPGRFSNAEIADRWSLYAAQNIHPQLSPNALGRAFRMHKARPFRTAVLRGWVVPPLDGAKPASPAPTVQEKMDRQDYLEAVSQHRGGTSTSTPRNVPLPGAPPMPQVNVADILRRRGIKLTGDTSGLPFEMETPDGS